MPPAEVITWLLRARRVLYGVLILSDASGLTLQETRLASL